MKLKAHLAANMPLYVFLGFYFLTTVVANAVYTTSWGRDWPSRSIIGFDWSFFSVPFGLAFWCLLLLPLIALPLSLLTKRAAQPLSDRLAPFFEDFGRPTYLAICAVSYAYVFWSLYHVNALPLLLSATDAIQAVEARFLVLAMLGFWPQVVMKSVLVFLAVYAVVKAARQGDRLWYCVVACHALALSFCLVLLNMKWPVVLFIITLGMAVFVTAAKRPILKTAAILAVGAISYLIVSAIVLRLEVPVDADMLVELERYQETDPGYVLPKHYVELGATQTVAAAAFHTPELAIVILNRMAMGVPFYYDIFTTEGQVCGTIADRILRRPHQCQPSTLVYEAMFPSDGFAGRGTVPAAVQIYGYALGGWAGAIIETVLASVMIGLFLSVWPLARRNDLMAAIFIMGGYAAYFLTQLPVEASVVYDHGILWWAALVLAVSLIPPLVRRLIDTRPLQADDRMDAQ